MIDLFDQHAAIIGTSGVGKALALDTPLPTPTGWTTMGRVRVGDWLLADDGTPCLVEFTTPPMTGHPCFEVTFSDGSAIIADADHLWRTEDYFSRLADSNARKKKAKTQGRGGRWQCQRKRFPSVVTTAQIFDTLRSPGGKANHVVKNTNTLQLPTADLPIDPYVLGVWLGDGTASDSRITTVDEEILELVVHAGCDVTAAYCTHPNQDQYRLRSDIRGIPLRRLLRESGLLNDKKIPPLYLRASEDQRRALLAGLMDTDGSVQRRSNGCTFYNTNLNIAEGVRELVSTLGWSSTLREKRSRFNGVDFGVCYEVRFRPDRSPFRLGRKGRLLDFTRSQSVRWTRRTIVSVRPVESVPVKCVRISAPSRLFLCGRSMIPTHNSFTARGLVEGWLKRGLRVCIIDPTDVWYGLRSNAAGDGPGFPIVVFGGDHQDIPIGENSGARIAELVAGRNLPAIISASHLPVKERIHFLTEFTSTLFRINREALHLVLDEADELAPQQPFPEQRRLLHWIDQIARRGRVKGFRLLMITQRTAVINNNVLGMAKVMVVHQLTLPHDRRAFEGWIKGQGDPQQASEVLGSLAGLQRGHGWLWAPQNGLLEHRQFPRIETFDSMRTPEHGETIAAPTKLARVEIDELRALLQVEPETAEQTRRPAADRQAVQAELQAAEQRGYERGVAEERARAEPLHRTLAAIRVALGAMDGQSVIADEGLMAEPNPPRVIVAPAERAPAHKSTTDLRISPSTLKIIEAIQRAYPVSLSFDAASRRAGVSKRSSNYSKYRREVDASLNVTMLTDGRYRASTSFPVVADGVNPLDSWCSRLPPSYGRMLRAIAQRRQDGATSGEVAADAEVSPTSSGLAAGLKELVNLELVDRTGDRYVIAEGLVT